MDIEDMTGSELLERNLDSVYYRIDFFDEGRVFGVNPYQGEIDRLHEEWRNMMNSSELGISLFFDDKKMRKIHNIDRKIKDFHELGKEAIKRDYGANAAVNIGDYIGKIGRTQKDRIVAYEVFLEKYSDESDGDSVREGFVDKVKELLESERKDFYSKRFEQVCRGMAA